jgi:hypothetical protein
MLIRERHLGNVLTMLLASHEFHVRDANVARDIIFRGLRQPPRFTINSGPTLKPKGK